MVDFPIRVVIDPTQAVRGAKKVKTALKGVEKQAFSIGKIFRSVFAFAGIAFGLAKLRDLGDTAIEVTNRLRVAGIATDGMAKATDRLFNISNKTRTPIKANRSSAGSRWGTSAPSCSRRGPRSGTSSGRPPARTSFASGTSPMAASRRRPRSTPRVLALRG